MRFSLKSILWFSLLLLCVFVFFSYFLSLKTSPVVWAKDGLALSQEVWDHIDHVWLVLRRYVYWIIGFYVVMAALVVLLEEQNPDRANLWLFTLLLFPFVGLAAYLFLGPNAKSLPHRWRMRKLSKRRLKWQFGNLSSQGEPGLAHLLAVSCGAVPTFRNEARVLLDGEETFEAIEAALQEAREYIHVEYFSFASDTIGTRVGRLLADRARAGVKVRFLYDSVGSWNIGRRFVAELRDSGVEVQAFMPVALARFRSGLNHRDHRKIVVVDGEIGFLGGLNVGDMYLGKDPTMGKWRDTHLSLRGSAVDELNRIFLEQWESCVGKNVDVGHGARSFLLTGQYTPVQIASSGPGSSFRAIADGYFHIIASARKRVWITTPYLVPGEALFGALSVAARSGVDVRVIVPSKADHRLVFWASQFNIDRLLRSGVRIFSYQDGFVHAKTLVADSQIVSVGTTNLDVRSLEINYEVQAFIKSEDLAARFERDFLNDLEFCEEETLIGRWRRPLRQKLQNAVGRLWTALV